MRRGMEARSKNVKVRDAKSNGELEAKYSCDVIALKIPEDKMFNSNTGSNIRIVHSFVAVIERNVEEEDVRDMLRIASSVSELYGQWISSEAVQRTWRPLSLNFRVELSPASARICITMLSNTVKRTLHMYNIEAGGCRMVFVIACASG